MMAKETDKTKRSLAEMLKTIAPFVRKRKLVQYLTVGKWKRVK